MRFGSTSTKLCSLGTSALFAGTLIASSLALSKSAMTGEGLELIGFPLVAYHVARVALVLMLTLSVFSAGAFLQKLLAALGQGSTSTLIQTIITSLVLGTAAVGLAMVVLGLAGLYYRPVAIGLVLCLCIPAPFLWAKMSTGGARLPPAPTLPTLPARVVGALTLACGVILLANRGLFLGETDNDVWEHYLHYYAMVTASHGIWPNDLWQQFYVSKAAGLFFLASLVGDVWTAQAASMVAMLLIALVGFSLARRATGEAVAGWLAAALLLAAWNNESEAGSFLKQHTQMAALVLGIFWCAHEAIVCRAQVRKNGFVVTGMGGAFYLGLYVPVASAFIFSGFAFMSALTAARPELRPRAWIAAAMGTCCVLGALAMLALNYALTGLPMPVPVNLFWPHVDAARFRTIWDPLVVEYWFLGPASPEAGQTGPHNLAVVAAWWLHLLRGSYLSPLVLTMLVAAGVVLIVGLLARPRVAAPRSGPGTELATVAVVMSFLIGTLLVGQAFQDSESVYRIYGFTLGLTIPSLVILLWRVLRLSGLRSYLCAWALVVVAVAGCSSFLLQVPPAHWTAVARFISGAASARESLRETEAAFPDRITVEDMIAFRTGHPDERRVMFLSYDPAPAYFLPNPPVVSEPSYAFGAQYGELLYGGSQAAKAILKRENIGYFAFDLRNRLFLGMPYTSLFAADSIGAEFGLAWHEGDIYVLGWRDEGITDSLPPRFTEVLQARKTGVIPPDAEQRWGADLATRLRSARRTHDQGSDYFDWLYDDFASAHAGHKGAAMGPEAPPAHATEARPGQATREAGPDQRSLR